MADDGAPENEGRPLALLIGAGALIAWFAMLWLMFADVM